MDFHKREYFIPNHKNGEADCESSILAPKYPKIVKNLEPRGQRTEGEGETVFELTFSLGYTNHQHPYLLFLWQLNGNFTEIHVRTCRDFVNNAASLC